MRKLRNNKISAAFLLIVIIYSIIITILHFNRFYNNSEILINENIPASYPLVVDESSSPQTDPQSAQLPEVVPDVVGEHVIKNSNEIKPPNYTLSPPQPIHSISDIPWTQNPIQGKDAVGPCNGTPTIKAIIISPNGAHPHYEKGSQYQGKLQAGYYLECMSQGVTIKWLTGIGAEKKIFANSYEIDFSTFQEGTHTITLIVGSYSQGFGTPTYYTSESSIQVTIGKDVHTDRPPTINIISPYSGTYIKAKKDPFGYYYVEITASAELYDDEPISQNNMEWYIQRISSEKFFIGNGRDIGNYVYQLSSCEEHQFNLSFEATDPTGLSSQRVIILYPICAQETTEND